MAQSRYSTPPPASETKAGQRRLRAYRLALGEFVDAFSKAEIFLHFVLRWYANTPAVVARAVFSGARTDVTRGFLKRMADAKVINAKDWAALSPVLEQLRIVSEKRNEILHYGADDIAEGNAYVSNAIMALTKERTYLSRFPRKSWER